MWRVTYFVWKLKIWNSFEITLCEQNMAVVFINLISKNPDLFDFFWYDFDQPLHHVKITVLSC